ncbi:MAG: hypothetical protein IKZ87_05740 [Actinomycetaceae bacterium]|nr:hypothetical protein [Actinomycetaceae bacterium]
MGKIKGYECELYYYDFDLSDSPYHYAKSSVSDDILRENILCEYAYMLPSGLNMFERRLPGVYVKRMATNDAWRSVLWGKRDTEHPICGYIIQKGAPLYKLDYISYHLKSTSFMRDVDVSNFHQKSGDVNDLDGDYVESPGGGKVAISPSQFYVTGGNWFSALISTIAWLILAPFAILFRRLYQVSPRLLKLGTTGLALGGVVASRAFAGIVLVILLDCFTTGDFDYARYLIERLIGSLARN